MGVPTRSHGGTVTCGFRCVIARCCLHFGDLQLCQRCLASACATVGLPPAEQSSTPSATPHANLTRKVVTTSIVRDIWIRPLEDFLLRILSDLSPETIGSPTL